MSAIADEVERYVEPKTVIRGPLGRARYTVLGYDVQDGERNLVYGIPNRKRADKPDIKRVPFRDINAGYERLIEVGFLKRDWYAVYAPERARGRPCNFTIIGSVLTILGYAAYDKAERCYIRVKRNDTRWTAGQTVRLESAT
jgi:hypothetical protein